MSKDYARKPRSSPRKTRYEPRVPAWVWLFTGSVLGAFIVFLVNLSKVEDAPESRLPFITDMPASSRDTQTGNPAQEIPPVEKPQSPFSFPELLRDSEIKVPEGEAGGEGLATHSPNIEYSLQVASFKERKDAEQVRAELILLNMEATIEQATVRENETWHRVIVGPFTSRSKLSKARSTLISNNYNAQVRKRSIPG